MGIDRRKAVWGLIALLGSVDLILVAVVAVSAGGARSLSVPHVFRTLGRSGLGPALTALERAAAADSAVLRDGHQLAHALGREAVRAGGNAAVIGECRPTFASGCYHGVVEAFIEQRGSVDMAELEAKCIAAASGSQIRPTEECIHGVGHGVLSATRMNVAQALSHCDELSKVQFRTGCHAGVFMEAIGAAFRDATTTPHHSHVGEHHSVPATVVRMNVLEPDNPFAPCDRYDDPYADSCWLFQGFVILRRVNFDPRAALELCETAPAQRIARCHESIGHQLTGLSQRGNDWVIEQCSAGSSEYGAQCAEGAVLALVAMDWSGSRAAQFCDAVPADWAIACRAAVVASQAERADAVGNCPSETTEALTTCSREILKPE